MPSTMLGSTENILVTKIDLVPALGHCNINIREINVVLVILSMFSIKIEFDK